jgi:hypothetical protein
VSTNPRAAQLLSLNQMHFCQIISGTNDNKATVSAIPTILLRDCGQHDAELLRKFGFSVARENATRAGVSILEANAA